MRISTTLLIATFSSVWLATGAAAQAAPSEHHAAFAVVPGFVSGNSQTGASIGGTVSVDVARWATIEGNGSYLDRGGGADAVALHLSLLAALPTTGRRVSPYVVGGAGIYRASFDLGAPRFFGGLGQYGPGVSLCGGTGACPYGQMPGFYGRRLGAVIIPVGNAGFGTRTFTDPAFSAGAGARVELASHLFLRPEARALFVRGGGLTHTLGTFSCAFGYRF